MPTTTIRIEDELKKRVAAMADRAGKTAHAFIVDAIAENVELAEMEAEVHRLADERWGKVLATGKTVPWNEAKDYLAGRARGSTPRKPAAKKLGNARGA